MSDAPRVQGEASPMDQPLPVPTMLDTTITLRQIRNWLVLFLIAAFVLYAWQFFRLAAHSEMGGGSAKGSPYFEEIPYECRGAADRHAPTNVAGILVDKFALRLRPLRIPAEKYLNTEYARIRCLGYAVLTGLHMNDSLDADFVDTYTDAHGKPIVRITVEYLQTYSYNPTQRKALTEKEQQ